MIIANGFQPLTIITKHSTLDVAAALDPPLTTVLEFLFSIKLQAGGLQVYKKGTSTQLFSREFCKIFKNIFDRAPTSRYLYNTSFDQNKCLIKSIKKKDNNQDNKN